MTTRCTILGDEAAMLADSLVITESKGDREGLGSMGMKASCALGGCTNLLVRSKVWQNAVGTKFDTFIMSAVGAI
jgi:hypothetical protein